MCGKMLPLSWIHRWGCRRWSQLAGFCWAVFKNQVKNANAQNCSNMWADQKYPEPIVIPKTTDKFVLTCIDWIKIWLKCSPKYTWSPSGKKWDQPRSQITSRVESVTSIRSVRNTDGQQGKADVEWLQKIRHAWIPFVSHNAYNQHEYHSR